MNCSTFQRRLLTLEEPAEMPDSIQAHLEACPHCQDLHRRLTQIERHLPVLPVPRSAAKADFLAHFRQQGTVWEKVRFRFRNLRRWQLTAGALAASLLLFFLAWNLAPGDPVRTVRPIKSSAPDKLLASLVKSNLKLAIATTPKVQVQTLAEVAEDLRHQSEPLLVYGSGREGKESLRELADWYGQVVRMSVTRAVKLPPEELRPVLDPIVQQLADATDEAERLGRDVKNVSADHPMFTIASAARNGKDHLERVLKQQEMALRAPVPRAADDGLAPRVSFLPVACLAAVQVRAEPSSSVVAADMAARFQRNRKLIQALVENCLRLSELTEAVQRASSCMVIAERLGEEAERAVADNDIGRATELTRAFKDLLVEGVAFNLTTARGEIPPGAVREAEMLQIGDHVKRITEPLQATLRVVAGAKDAPERWQRLVKLVTDSQAAVNKALKDRGGY
jgi:hypothetical protein